MADSLISYQRVTPKARAGTTGICVSYAIDATEGPAGAWISPPDRVAAVSVAVYPLDTAVEYEYRIECCFDEPSEIGVTGTGGWWFPIYEPPADVYFNTPTVKMIANSTTGIRVLCTRGKVRACFVG